MTEPDLSRLQEPEFFERRAAEIPEDLRAEYEADLAGYRAEYAAVAAGLAEMQRWNDVAREAESNLDSEYGVAAAHEQAWRAHDRAASDFELALEGQAQLLRYSSHGYDSGPG